MGTGMPGQSTPRRLLASLVMVIAAGALPASALQRAEVEELRPDEARSQPDHVAVRVLGRARSVSRDSRSFVVDAGDLRFQVEFDDGRGTPGFGTRPPELREGDRVVVYGNLIASGRLQARRVVLVGSAASTERRLTGQVRSIDARRGRLVVRDEDGASISVDAGSQTVVARLGRRASLDDLRAGDAVWVAGRWIDRSRVAAERIEVTDTRAAWRSGDAGDIVSINRRESLLNVRFSGDTRRVDASQADLLSEGRRANPDRLRVGERVRVYGAERGSTIVARRVELLGSDRGDDNDRLVAGRVRSVDVGARVILLTTEDLLPATQRVYVPRGVVIDRFGRRLDLREIQTGDRIRVLGERRDGRFEATSIQYLR